MGKYQITKTIRFKLEPKNKNAEELKLNLQFNDTPESAETVLSNLILCAEKLNTGFIEYIKNKKIFIHYRWLTNFTKNNFFQLELKDKLKKYQIHEIDYLPGVLDDFVKQFYNVINDLKNDISKDSHKKMRKADTALLIKKLTTKQFFPFIKQFVLESNDKNSDELKNILTDDIEQFERLLDLCKNKFLSAQSSGICLVKASFNYYTLNKKEKDFDKEKKVINEKLNKNPQDQLEKKYTDILNKVIKHIKSKDIGYSQFQQNEIIDFENCGLDKLQSLIKEYKSNQKRMFFEAINNLRFDDIKERFPLFVCEKDKYDKFLETTKKITDISAEKNKLKKEDLIKHKDFADKIKLLKQKRADYFKSKSCIFGEYKLLCDLYKKLSQDKGRLKAQLKGIENEKLDSQRLTHWSLLLEKNKRHTLILVPKKISSIIYKKIEGNTCVSDDVDGVIYYFESFTYRALKKLCFGVNNNTFQPEIKTELSDFLKEEFPKYKNKEFGEFLFYKDDGVSKDEEKLIKFYKKILDSNYVKQNLKLPDNIKADVIDKDYLKLSDFIIALEKCCYVRKIAVDKTFLSEWKNDILLFDITSQDINKLDKTNLKQHTRIWLNFWKEENEKNGFDIRLSPEISIMWREPKETRVEKYGINSKLYDKTKRNRYLYEQFTLCSSFMENSLYPQINHAFKDIKEKGKAIIDFNSNINENISANANVFYYGIDTGVIEYATLALAKKENNKFIPQKFTVYEINDLNFSKQGYVYNNGVPFIRKTPYKAVQNLSYFLNRELYDKTFKDNDFDNTFRKLFKEKEVSGIDLTMAKLINGKIVLNGDISILLNLKILHTKRKIYQKIIVDPAVKLEEKDYGIFFSGEKQSIYQSRRCFDSIRTYNTVKEEIYDYFNSSKKNSVILEEQINKMRKVLAGNMVGIINFLYAQYPGVIAIENLDQSKVEAESKIFAEGKIERPLEWALYNKFQNKGLVPPITELIKLRAIGNEKGESIKQFGIIKFVNEEDSSLLCPVCDNKAYKNNSAAKEDKDLKIFKCSCGFHNINNPLGFDSLDSNDKVAAFNIAKRWFDE